MRYINSFLGAHNGLFWVGGKKVVLKKSICLFCPLHDLSCCWPVLSVFEDLPVLAVLEVVLVDVELPEEVVDALVVEGLDLLVLLDTVVVDDELLLELLCCIGLCRGRVIKKSSPLL